jgi:aspartate/methionine/tyrosine aminotransferase
VAWRPGGGRRSRAGLQAHLRRCRDRLVGALQALPGVEVALPPGGMYAFFRVEGEDDSLAFAKRWCMTRAWGWRRAWPSVTKGEGWLRWCFASRDPQRLLQGVQRLERALKL